MDTPLVSIKVIPGAEASYSGTIRLHTHIRLGILPLGIAFSHRRPWWLLLRRCRVRIAVWVPNDRVALLV